MTRLGLVIVSVYLAYAAVMVWLHPSFIYPFRDTAFDDPRYDRIQIATGDVDPAVVYVASAEPGAPAVVYFMGNVGALTYFQSMLDHHLEAGRHVIAMAYPGGGGLPGAPSEAVLKRHARAVVHAVPDLVEHGSLILHGYSLGTGLAVAATGPDVDGLILSAPYDQLCRLMAAASYLPACTLPVQRWDTLADVGNLKVPILILHGSDDTVVPIENGIRLAVTMSDAGEQVDMLRLDGAGHADLLGHPAFLPAIDDFIAKHHAQP